MRSNANGRTACATPRTAASDSGSRFGADQTNVTRSSPGVTKIVSPLKSTPAPPAPPAQCTTALPGKCPPHCTRVTPGSTGSATDQVLMADDEPGSHPASTEGSTISAPNTLLHSPMAP